MRKFKKRMKGKKKWRSEIVDKGKAGASTLVLLIYLVPPMGESIRMAPLEKDRHVGALTVSFRPFPIVSSRNSRFPLQWFMSVHPPWTTNYPYGESIIATGKNIFLSVPAGNWGTFRWFSKKKPGTFGPRPSSTPAARSEPAKYDVTVQTAEQFNGTRIWERCLAFGAKYPPRCVYRSCRGHLRMTNLREPTPPTEYPRNIYR